MPNAWSVKTDKLGLFKMRNIYSVKNPIKRMNGQNTDREKMFANHISDKRLLSRIYVELPKLENRKQYKYK